MRRALRLRLGRRGIEREVEDELAFHLEMRTRRLIEEGVPPDEARAEALRQFGDLESVRRSCVTYDEERERAMQRVDRLGELLQDTRYAVRALRRNVGFAVAVVLTLALGIGANTAIFTLVDAVLLRELDVPEPDQLVAIGVPSRVNSMSVGDVRTDIFSYPLYRELRDRNQIVTGLMASGRTERLDVRGGGGGQSESAEPEHPSGRYVSGNYFSVLGIPAALGRTFTDADDRAVGASPVVVISHGYWMRRYAGDRGLLGRQLRVNAAVLTIIGVAAPNFQGEIVGQYTDLWMPITAQPLVSPNRPLLEDVGSSWLLLLGRLRPGVTLDRARTGFTTLAHQVIEQLPGTGPRGVPSAAARRDTVAVSSGAKGFSRVRVAMTVPLVTLMAGVGLLLLIVCANVGTLMLARALARSREMSVRLALGAGRNRIVRQLLTESVLLALLGAVAGLAFAWWGSHALLSLVATSGPVIPLDLRLDLRILGFTLALSIAAVILFGLAPAVRGSRIQLASALRASTRAVGGGFAASGHRIPIGRLMVAAQVALSLLLLVGAALLVRSLRTLEHSDTGLDRDHLLIVDVEALKRGYGTERLETVVRDLSARLEQLPGVAAVTWSENGVFSGTESQTTLQVEGFIPSAPEDSLAYYDQVGARYAAGLGARLLQGRDLVAADDRSATRVVLVNESFAKFYFPDGRAVGKNLRMDSVSAQIVGVIGDVKDHDLKGASGRRVYFQYFHPEDTPGRLRFVVRATGEPALLGSAVRGELRAVEDELRILSIQPLTAMMRQSVAAERLLARLASGFGSLALLLAALGIYGVMSYAMARRTGEIGLRMALGAQRADVVRMVLLDALRLVASGVIVGLPLAMAAVRLLRNQLHGVGPTDPVAISAALAVMLASAVIAALVPARRAAGVAPLVALQRD
jgi:predicted permease